MNKRKPKVTKKQASIVNKTKAGSARGTAPNKKKNLIPILIALVVTAIVYAGSLGNGWVKNWDDGAYLLDYTNPLGNLVHKLSLDNIKAIFSVFYVGNYHPLTTLVYALEYSIAGESPFLYHLLNLLIHLSNIILVYIILKLLTKRMEIAFIAALLFGIHPMHVESVAWISELKDVLYGFFFLAAMVCYYYFIDSKTGNKKYFFISLFAFILSALSKSAAVTLPVVLLLMDYYMKRKWQWKLLVEKIPFFIISIIFGIVAIYSQKSSDALQDLTPLYAWYERPLFASYAAMMYLVKLIVPINLATYYPYSGRIAGHLPVIYYVAPFVILLLILLVFHSRKNGRDIVFGSLFFIITISLVLQMLPVGGAIMAERYSYIPYIGLFMIIGRAYVFSKEGISQFAKNVKWLVPGAIIIGSIFFSILSFQRIKVWKDGEALFTDLINKYPAWPFAYDNRGYLYFKYLKNNEKALADYNKCIAFDSNYYNAYSNRGVLYYNFYGPGKSDSFHLQLALKDFSKALKFKSDNTDALIGRANTYSSMQKFGEALPDYDKYIALMPGDAKAYLWRGIAFCQTGRYNEAITDLNNNINMLPGNANAYQWRGKIYLQLKDYKAAMVDFDQSLSILPAQADALSGRGLAKFNLKMFNEAIADFNTILKQNPNEPSSYINRSAAYFELKNYEQAFNDYYTAGKLQYPLDKERFFKLKALAGK